MHGPYLGRQTVHPVGTTETSDLRVCPYWNATDFFRNRTDETEFYDHVRSLMPLSPLRVPNSGPQTSPVAALFLFPAAGVPSSECSLWVKSRHMQCTRACPLRPKKRTQDELENPKLLRFIIFVAMGARRVLKDTSLLTGLPRGETERRLAAVFRNPLSLISRNRAAQSPSSFPRVRIIKRHLAETLLCPRRPLEFFDERCMLLWLVGAWDRQSTHQIRPQAAKLGFKISQRGYVRVRVYASWHAFSPRVPSRFAEHRCSPLTQSC